MSINIECAVFSKRKQAISTQLAHQTHFTHVSVTDKLIDALLSSIQNERSISVNHLRSVEGILVQDDSFYFMSVFGSHISPCQRVH